jgi:hypothetical protein
MDLEQVLAIASLFHLPAPIQVYHFPEKGNINRETYLVAAGPRTESAEYILQQLNPGVFKKPADSMRAMISCIEAQRQAILNGALRGDEEWEVLRLIPTKRGRAYLETTCEDSPCCWRMMAKIGQARAYKSLQEIPDSSARLQTAEEAGRGLALFGTLTTEMNPRQIHCPLPGYRDTGLYYDQLLSVLAGNRTPTQARSYLPTDPALRQSTEDHFLVQLEDAEYQHRRQDPLVRWCIDLALGHKSHALKLARGLETGDLRTVLIHGDTKLENFLFSTRTGKAKALVDLDTIMPHTWLSDWGDMARSLINPAGERETDLTKVTVDLEVFESAACGFLNAARHIANHEAALMTDAVQIMSLELGVRFLTDYLRGDSYFSLESADPPDLNRTRALVQFRLFENVRVHSGRLERIIADCLEKIPSARGSGSKG